MIEMMDTEIITGRNSMIMKDVGPEKAEMIFANNINLNMILMQSFQRQELLQEGPSNKNKKFKRVRGASTISQQVAKNVFLWQGRSWIRKGLEAYTTFMIELVWGKRRILEMYLNVSEMGKGVFGIEAASRYYFKKSAKKLTRLEAALITAGLPNPKKYRISPPSNYVAQRGEQIVVQMGNLEPDADIRELLK